MSTPEDVIDLSVNTDKLDYAPGEDVTLTISGVTEGGSVTIAIADDVSDPGDDGDADIYTPYTVTDGGAGDLDGLANGSIITTWSVPTNGDANNATLDVVVTDYGADGVAGGADDREAATSFTDAVQTDYKHFANTTATWQNGTLQQSNSQYVEGEVVPHYYEVENVIEGQTYYFYIYFDHAFNDATGYDGGFIGLAQYNATESPPPVGAPQGSGITPTLDSTGNLISTVNADVTLIGPTAYFTNSNLTQGYVLVKFTPNDGDNNIGEEIDAEFYWGLKLALAGDTLKIANGTQTTTATEGASGFSGASLQTNVAVKGALNEGSSGIAVGGGGTLQINPNAVIPPTGSITIIKDAQPNDLQDFSFTTTGTGLSNFSLDDDAGVTGADALLSNTKTFSGLTSGTYTIDELGLAGWNLQNITIVESVLGNSTINLNTGIATINLEAGETVTLTYTNVKQGSLSGYKYHDLNGDGDQDAGELGLEGWTIKLFKDGIDTGKTAITDANGYYEFKDLAPGNYSTEEVLKAGWVQSDPSSPETLTSGENDTTGNDFGNYQKGSLSGYKYHDLNGDGDQDAGELGLEGWTIKLFKDGIDTGKTAITDANGYYEFKDLAPGNYSTEEVLKAGWVQSDPSSPETLTSGENDTTGNDFGNYQKGSLSGYKYHDLNGDGDQDAGELGLEGWTIKLFKDGIDTGKTAITDANGYYEFKDLAPGNYSTEEVLKAGWVQSDPSSPETLTSGENDTTGNDFGNYQKGSLSGYKYHDLNGDGDQDAGELGLEGWTIKLFKDGIDTGKTAITDANGYYEFKDLAPGNYSTEEVLKAGWVQSDPSSPETLTSGENDTTGNDFGNYQKGSLSGYKYHDLNGDGDQDAGELGLEGWTIKLFKDGIDTGKTAITDANGYYEFKDLAPGNYSTEEVLKAGWVQSDPSSPETLTSGENDTTGNDFGNYQKGKVEGYKYRDANADGVRDLDGADNILGGPGAADDEAGVAGITIELYKKSDLLTIIATTVTDSDGKFAFENLDPGEYVVKEIVPVGSGAITEITSEFKVASGDFIKLGYVFGNYEEASLCGYKYHDRNGDGDRDQGEEGLAGWTIKLFKEDKNGVPVFTGLTQTTDENGYYKFTGLAPGKYSTQEVLSDKPGWYQSDSSDAEELLSGEQDAYGNDFGNYQRGKITGEKYIDNDASGTFTACDVAKAGWTVKLYNDVDSDGVLSGADTLEATTTTNAAGTYNFDGIDPGKYVVVEDTPTGWHSKAPTQYGVEIESGETYGDGEGENTDFFNYQKGCLSGCKYNDKNADGYRDKDGKDNTLNTADDEVGLAGWTIQLFKDGKFTGKTAITDANGFYKFTDLDPGNYSTKEVAKAGWIQTDPSSPEKLTSGENDKYGNDFGNFLPKPKIDLDKQVASVTGGYKDKYGAWVADSAGDVINYKFVLKNLGNVAVKNVVLKDYFENSAGVTLSNATVTGDYGTKGVLDVGETWTYSLKHTVTQTELNAARKIVTEVQKIGFFTCYVKKCTGDLQLDNFAKVTADASIPGGYSYENSDARVSPTVVKLTDADFETVKVNCPTGCVSSTHGTYGGSTAEVLWQNYQHASA